jgi:type I restriction enzyme R subunit
MSCGRCANPRTACFQARLELELSVEWAYKHHAALKLPYQDSLSALIHEPSFKQTAGEAIFNKTRVMNTLGNRAVLSHRAVAESKTEITLFTIGNGPVMRQTVSFAGST